MICAVPAAGNCGVYDYTVELVRRLSRGNDRHRPVEAVLCVNDVPDGHRRDYLEAHDVRALELGKTWNRSAVSALLRALGRDEWDVVHLMYPARGYGRSPWVSVLPLLLRARSRGLPIVVSLHEFRQVRALRRLASLPLILFADVLHLTSDVESGFVGRLPGSAAKTRVIRLGSNITPVEDEGAAGIVGRPSVASLVGTPPTAQVVFFGLVRPDKGLPSLLRAFAAAEERSRRAARLVVIAEPVGDPGLRREVDRLVHELDLGERLEWAAALTAPEVSQRLLEADLCVLPYSDGVSFRRGSFIAAITHGLPVITTRAQNAPSALEHGENVWLVPPGDSDALAGAIRRLLDAEPERHSIGEGAKRLSEQFSWDRSLTEWVRLYQQLSG